MKKVKKSSILIITIILVAILTVIALSKSVNAWIRSKLGS